MESGVRKEKEDMESGVRKEEEDMESGVRKEEYNEQHCSVAGTFVSLLYSIGCNLLYNA